MNASRHESPTRNIALIGNSNSISVTSFAWLLEAMPGIKLSNYSIGGVVNIALLPFLANRDIDFSSFDVIIIELSIVEGQYLYPGSPYSTEDSEEVLDLFFYFVQQKSSARVLFLILPTLAGIINPARFFAEKHYVGSALKHGAAILNGYGILRDLGGLNPEGPSPDLVASVERLIAVFNLPPTSRERYIWRLWLRQSRHELHRADIGTKAFAEHCFEDPIHISRAFHNILAKLLYHWICRAEQRSTPLPRASESQEVVMSSSPQQQGGDVQQVHRHSHLITRDLMQLGPGSSVTYRCPSGFFAAGILINESSTSGFLAVSSIHGDSTIDLRFEKRNIPWRALIVSILDEVGDGDISVTISKTRPTTASPGRRHYLKPADTQAEGVAEVGELLLVRRDWRGAFDGVTYAPGSPEVIEETAWAKEIIEPLAAFGAKVFDGVRRSMSTINRSDLRSILGKSGIAHPETAHLEAQITILAASGEFDAAWAVLANARQKNPDDIRLKAMQDAIPPSMR